MAILSVMRFKLYWRTFFTAIIVSLLLYGCHYIPYAKYYRQKKSTDLPRFSEKNHFKGSIHALRASYDITTYDWTVYANPEKESIEGSMKIDFLVVEPEKTILLDLQKRLKIKDISSNIDIESWNKTSDLLYIYFAEPMPPGKKVFLQIDYFGKPVKVLDEGPIQWKEDGNGKPWVSTQTQGIGPHMIMPCKDLLYDEPEQCIVRVGTPKGLTGVANGKLDSVTQEKDYSVYHWSVRNPINVYGIAFSIGDYELIEIPYTDINNNQQKIEVYALKEDAQEAREFYLQTPMHMAEFEKMFGSFPWWEDGCKFVQTTHEGSAMEHQSAISMGSILTNDYRPPVDLHINTTLVHELAHEWWGNSLTASDYCDMWLHEGMATFCEALVIEQLYNEGYYNHYFWRYMSIFTKNERPLLKICGVRYNSWVSGKDQDIYTKGALMMHTVRRQLNNDTLFFGFLKDAYSTFERKNITTTEFVEYFNDYTQKDFTPLFNLYLKYAEPPSLLYYIDEVNNVIRYKWEKPLKEDFPFMVAIRSDTIRTNVYPTLSWQSIPVDTTKETGFNIGDFGYVLFNKVKSPD